MIKNQELASRIIEMNDTLIEASEYLYSLYNKCEYILFDQVSKDMLKMLESMHNGIVNIKNKESLISIDLEIQSINYSLNNIIKLFYARSTKVLSKIEFELIPLLQELKINFYYWGCIYPDKKRLAQYYKEDMIRLSCNIHIDQAERDEFYKYDLSIIITGYNKLEYTKLCVESVLKYVPKNLNYELILVNHGSNDGTKEYFESISPTKQFDISLNGGGLLAISRVVEGKYALVISNDVVITKNAISNMISCMDSDEKIAYVVPTTPNISNFQTIESNYSNLGEMFDFAYENNIMDKYRWEQRVRLCNPICMIRSNVFYSSKGLGINRYYTTANIQSFPDDNISLLLRRNRYKMILAKDAYCYHFGGITLSDETSHYKDKNNNIGQQAFYEEGRKEFFDVFGIDPWGTGCCWDKELFQCLKCNDTEHVDVLGINCGIGSNPLKVKERIKENMHNLDVITYNVTDEKCYIEDLKGVSDFAEYICDCSDVENIFEGNKFKYIIVESKIETYENPLVLIADLENRLVTNGIIAIKTCNENLQKEIKRKYLKAIQSGEWIILK